MILLSVCIATRNRAEYLDVTLASLVPQLREDVEIVIVDGASTDATADVLAGWRVRCPAVRYVRHETNGGVDRDYAAAVEMARGIYCWLFTDDDLLHSGAVGTVLSRLASEPSLVLVNAEVWNRDFTRPADLNRLGLDHDVRYEPGDDDALLAATGAHLSFIGAVVIRKELWQSRSKTPYFGSLFIHFGVIFQAPLPEHAIAVAQPLIRIRYGNAGWSARTFEIWMHKWPDLVWSMPLARAAKRAVTPRRPWLNPWSLILQRAAGCYTIEVYRDWIPKSAPRPARWIAFTIACLPFRPLNLLLRLLLSISGMGHRTMAIDLRMAARKRT